MSVSIRLARGGTKKRPVYRIVATNSRSPRDGRFLEKLGTYNPLLPSDSPQRVVLREERIRYWLGDGAQPSDRVARFLDGAGITAEHRPLPRHRQARQGDRGQEGRGWAQAAAAAPAAGSAPAEEAAPASAPEAATAEAEARPRSKLRSLSKPPRRTPTRPTSSRRRAINLPRATSETCRRRELSCAELAVMVERARDRDWVCVAAVATAHGVRGALKLRCFTERARGRRGLWPGVRRGTADGCSSSR